MSSFLFRTAVKTPAFPDRPGDIAVLPRPHIVWPERYASSPSGLRDVFRLSKTYTAVLSIYALVLAFAIHRHEPWFDEAQAWLIANDLSFTGIAHWLRYEGTPGLWHYLLWVEHLFHAPYSALSFTSGIIAVAGVFVFLRYAPFPAIVKVLFPFTFWILYQYAVVARSYVLVPLLAFLASHFYRRERTWPFLLTICLLANVCAHGTLIATCMGIAYAWQHLRRWKWLDAKDRMTFFAATAIYTLVLIGIVLLAAPPHDHSLFDGHYTSQPLLDAWSLIAPDVFVHSVLASTVITASIIAWCAFRRRQPLVLLAPALVLAFLARVYCQPWHDGTVFIAIIAALWMVWPGNSERHQLRGAQRREYLGMTALLALVLLYQVTLGYKSVHFDLRNPYSGSEDAAAYLKSVGADKVRTFGYGFNTTAVLPYFGHNIYTNQAVPEGTSFWRWRLREAFQYDDLGRIAMDRPEYVVMAWKLESSKYCFAEEMSGLGYVPVHQSPGSMFFKDRLQQYDNYIIYRRVH